MTAVLAPELFEQFWNQTTTAPAIGFKEFWYLAGTSTKTATWTDSTQGTFNSNPIILDSTGSANVWLDPTVLYKWVLAPAYDTDPPTSPIRTVDNIAPPINISLIPNPYPILSTEVGVTNQYLPYGNIIRYGADPSGVNDSSTAIANALTSWLQVTGPPGTFTCSIPFNVNANQSITGAGPSTVFQFANGALNNFVCSGITGATFRDFAIRVIGANGTSTYGAIYLLNSSFCTVQRVTITGFNWSGVWLDGNSDFNTITQNNISGAQEQILNGLPAGTGADVSIYSSHGAGTAAPSDNLITDNDLNGGGGFGVQILDEFATVPTGLPFRNRVSGNRIGAHAAYGLLMYIPGAGSGAVNTVNQYHGNQVANAQGARGLDGVVSDANQTTGAGIYLVGAGIGGAQVHGNEVQNCCINTRTRTLVPAGIGFGGCASGLTPPSIIGNTITGMTQGDGIQISGGPTSGLGGVIVSGNSITMPSSNNGTGPGGATMQGSGLSIISGAGGLDKVVIGENNVVMYGAGSALSTSAASGNLQGITMTGGSYTVEVTGTGLGWQSFQVGGFNIINLKMTGTNIKVSSGTGDALNLSALIVASFAGVVGISSGGRGLFLNGCTNVGIVGGEFVGATVSIQTSGACTSSFVDKTVELGITTGATGSVVVNGGTGCNIEQNFTDVPTAGSWIIGDRAPHLGVVAGQAKAWARVTSGSANALGVDWISEGNL
jgi:hypothetical protein